MSSEWGPVELSRNERLPSRKGFSICLEVVSDFAIIIVIQGIIAKSVWGGNSLLILVKWKLLLSSRPQEDDSMIITLINYCRVV